MFADLGEKYKLRRWEWVWTEGGVLPELEAALEVGGFGYPALAVVNSRKARFSLLRGAFNLEGIDELLKGIALGRGGTSPLQAAGIPRIADTEPWDGKDGLAFVEDDVNLSDFNWDDEGPNNKDEL